MRAGRRAEAEPPRRSANSCATNLRAVISVAKHYAQYGERAVSEQRYQNIGVDEGNVTLVEIAARILPARPPELSTQGSRKFKSHRGFEYSGTTVCCRFRLQDGTMTERDDDGGGRDERNNAQTHQSSGQGD